MTLKPNSVLLLSDGEIAMWTNDERSIHRKAVTEHGDPVESNAEQARELAAQLLQLALIGKARIAPEPFVYLGAAIV